MKYMKRALNSLLGAGELISYYGALGIADRLYEDVPYWLVPLFMAMGVASIGEAYYRVFHNKSLLQAIKDERECGTLRACYMPNDLVPSRDLPLLTDTPAWNTILLEPDYRPSPAEKIK
jgi:hypothetical protein